jgi:ABC-type branched-subunit amino acid transport system substrate-binding protein
MACTVPLEPPCGEGTGTLARSSMRLRCFSEVVTLAILALPVGLLAQPARDTLRIGVVLSAVPSQGSDNESIGRGLELGTEEAARTAALFGFTIEVIRSPEANAPALTAMQWLLDRHATAIVAAGDPDECAVLSQIAATRRIVLITLNCRRDFQRAEQCTGTAFHLSPSDTTRARAPNLASRGGRERASREGSVVTWHHSLARFGAEQLNERFRRRFGAEMESSAWAAWLALKILAETALRARTTRASEIARYLVRRDTRFDGHKGEALTFEPRTGELRQPLYLLGGGSPGEERVIGHLTSAILFPGAAAASEQKGECAPDSGPSS